MLQLILRWLIPVTNPGASNWFMTWWAFTLYLLPCRLAICLPTPLPTATRWFLLTRSVPVCLPRYLIPCNHMMLSQRRVVRERDCYSVSASKILALTPSCCSPDHSPPPLRQLDSILFSKGAETPSSASARGKRGRTLKEHFTDWISFFFVYSFGCHFSGFSLHYTCQRNCTDLGTGRHCCNEVRWEKKRKSSDDCTGCKQATSVAKYLNRNILMKHISTEETLIMIPHYKHTATWTRGVNLKSGLSDYSR